MAEKEESVEELTKKLEEAKLKQSKMAFERRDPMQSVEDMYRATEELRNRLWTDAISIEKSNAINRLDNTLLRQIEVDIKLERSYQHRKPNRRPMRLFGPVILAGDDDEKKKK